MFDSKLLNQLRILYVEDDETIRGSLQGLFEKVFGDVICAVDGKDGFNKYQEEFENNRTVDVIISDITMPIMDGIEMLKLIKEYDAKIPFILTTAYSDVHYFKEAIKLNVTHYAIKPINIKEVMTHIQEICAIKFQERAIIKKQNELEEYLKAIDQVALISKTDKEGIITFVNKTFCEVSGYSEAELVGEPHSIVRHPESSSKTFEELWSTISSGNIWKNKLKNLSKMGHSYYVNTTIIPIFDKYDDEICEYISIRFLTTFEEEEKRKFKKQVIKNMGNIKKDFTDLKKENELLKDQLKFMEHVDLIQKQLDSERKRNKEFLGQIYHYEKEIGKITKRSNKLIEESKARLTQVSKENKEFKKQNDALVQKVLKLERVIEIKDSTIANHEINISNKSKKITDLYDVIDYREKQLEKLGMRLEPHKNDES